MPLATIADLQHIGALAMNEDPTSLRYQRAEGLLTMAAAQAANYIQITHGVDAAALTGDQSVVLAGIIAEIAGSRLQADTAPSTEFAPNGAGGYVSSIMNRQHERALDRLFSRGGSSSVPVDRDASSSWFRLLGDPDIVL